MHWRPAPRPSWRAPVWTALDSRWWAHPWGRSPSPRRTCGRGPPGGTTRWPTPASAATVCRSARAPETRCTSSSRRSVRRCPSRSTDWAGTPEREPEWSRRTGIYRLSRNPRARRRSRGPRCAAGRKRTASSSTRRGCPASTSPASKTRSDARRRSRSSSAQLARRHSSWCCRLRPIRPITGGAARACTVGPAPRARSPLPIGRSRSPSPDPSAPPCSAVPCSVSTTCWCAGSSRTPTTSATSRTMTSTPAEERTPKPSGGCSPVTPSIGRGRCGSAPMTPARRG